MPESGIRTENAGDIIYAQYTTTPATPTYSDIELYFASNDQTLPNDSDYDLDDSKTYYVSDTGTYTVYYKDNCTGVRSANFTLKIADILTFRDRIDYSLSQGWAPFVLTRSGGRPYKYKKGDAHYVCIIGFEEYTNAEGSLESYVIVSNCHWVGTVLGIYAIPLDEFYNKVDELFYYELPTA